MKTKIFMLAAALTGLALTACDDDDNIFINTEQQFSADSVATGSSDVTATSATFHGTAKGLADKSSSFYSVGFNYGYAADALTNSVSASVDGEDITATVSGLPTGVTIYYQTYLTLKGKVTYTGEIKSLVTTDAKVTTAEPSAIDYTGAVMGGSVTDATDDSTVGIVIAASSDVEAVRAGLVVPADENASTFTVSSLALMPGTQYYYAAYLDLGSGVVYGDVKQFTTADKAFDANEDLVDLGLSVKWAKTNVGAKTESDKGIYVSYGDATAVSNSYDTSLFPTEDIYKTSYDFVNTITGGKATLPSQDDFEELFANCSAVWEEVDGIGGYRFTGPNGNSIFLPAAGSRLVNDVTGVGEAGIYATGSINPENTEYALAYQFKGSNNGRATVPVYQALSVRPVSTARSEALDMDLLCNSWEIDYNNGETTYWNGPVWFYGTQDCWGTVTNNEPLVGDVWCWDADKTNTWAFGDCSGYMTINADGTIEVQNQSGEVQTGTYTIDTSDMTITSTVDLLAPDNFVSPMVENRKTKIKILSLSENGLQLGYYRDSEPATLSVNMVPATKKYGFNVSVLAAGNDYLGAWGVNVDLLMPANLEGSHTAVYTVDDVNFGMNAAMVFCLDIQGLHEAYPDAIVTITGIRTDGNDVTYDAAKFFYGDIEKNGNFRVEMYNTWGKGASDGIVESPFSNISDSSDPAVSFSSKLEIDYTIMLEPVFTPTLITINPEWGGTWDYNEGVQMSINVDAETAKYTCSPSELTFNYQAPADIDFSAGSIMTFVQISGLMNIFPGTQAHLVSVATDGTELTGWDPAMIYNTNDGDAWRLELWNMYGTSSTLGCAFGTPDDNGVISALAFSNSLKVAFAIDSLFAPVTF